MDVEVSGQIDAGFDADAAAIADRREPGLAQAASVRVRIAAVVGEVPPIGRPVRKTDAALRVNAEVAGKDPDRLGVTRVVVTGVGYRPPDLCRELIWHRCESAQE